MLPDVALLPPNAGFTHSTANLGVTMDFFPPGHGHSGGQLTIAGERADELAQAYGTPLLVLDLQQIDASVARLRGACDPHGVRISYAAKALLIVALARRLDRLGLAIDVCSLGELATAQRAGIAPERITFHGAGKSDAELQAALDGRVGRTIVDSLDELRRLAHMQPRSPLSIVLRLNTGIEAHTHDFIRTAGDNSKFGIAPHEEPAALALLTSEPMLRLSGLHAHIGSQIYQGAPFAANAEGLMEAMGRFMRAGAQIETLILGGGFGIPTHPDASDERLDLDAAIAGAVQRVRERADDLGLPIPRLEIEPGRTIVGNAGTSLYRVMAIKRYDRRTFVIVDGSLADNPRPALYGAQHYVVPTRTGNHATHEVTLCGRSCENDELGAARLPTDLAQGDLLAMCSTGAYTYSMASNYNRFARPAVIAVGDGPPRVYARRETTDDILRCDVDD